MSAGRRRPLLALTMLPLGLLATSAAKGPDCGCEASPQEVAAGETPTHDPAIAKDGSLYALFNTGRGIQLRTSRDLKAWGASLQVFDAPPAWAAREIVGFRDVEWAPDVSRFGGKWHLYYAVSTFGKNRSVIGHATNATLDPTSKAYKWVDEGPVFQSYPADDYNAIDPCVVLDAKGMPWMAFGSFWGGLRMVRLGMDGKLAPGEKPRPIAARPHEGPEQPGAIEAPALVRHGGYFYLFASFDFCCRGVRSTYNVRVGRAKAVEGPYLDRDGKAMVGGGGTKVLDSGPRWKGPGGESILHDGRKDLLVYHAYDAEDNGRPKLRIAEIRWDKDGWPSVPPPG